MYDPDLWGKESSYQNYCQLKNALPEAYCSLQNAGQIIFTLVTTIPRAPRHLASAENGQGVEAP